MSLINQMLRDLQQQKKPGGTKKTDKARSWMPEHIPYLPLPLVLSGVALLTLFLIWWAAGALSDMMFGFEPVAKPVESHQLVVTEPPPVAEKSQVAAVEQEQLTAAEREVEEVAPPVAIEQPLAKTMAPATMQAVKTVPVAKAASVKQAVAVQEKPAIATPASSTVRERKPATAPSRTLKTTRQVKSLPAPAPRAVVAKVPERLHPDDLPGAVLSRSRRLQEPEMAGRPSRAAATTPYGMAEEAFLDGKWALEQNRGGLAVRSLQYALELYPGHLPARELLVETFGKEGKAGEAMFLLAEGLEIAPDYAAFKKRYVRLLVDQGDYDAAAKVMLQGGLPTVEADPDAHVLLASLYQRLGEPFLAAQTYRNLLVAWPQTGAFWVGLGGALEGQNLVEEAVVCYRRALETKDLRTDLSLYAQKRLNLLD